MADVARGDRIRLLADSREGRPAGSTGTVWHVGMVQVIVRWDDDGRSGSLDPARDRYQRVERDDEAA